jgi:hypothetical protein
MVRESAKENMKRVIGANALLAIVVFFACGLSLAKTNKYILYVGTYTGAESKGIYAYG